MRKRLKSALPASRTRILHIITNLPVGGAQDNTLLTVERLDRRRFDVCLMCSSEGLWLRRALQLRDVDLVFVDELTRRIHPLFDLIALWRIYRYIKVGRFEIVHTHSSKPGFLGRIAAALAGVPIIIHTIHGFPFHDFMHPLVRRFYILVERSLSKLTHRIVTVSNLNRHKAIQLRLARREKFVNIYSGIDFRKFSRRIDVERKKQELGITNGEKVVGMVGRLSVQKAPWIFIQAIPEILRKERDVRFLVVGDGELRDRMMDLADELDVSDRTMFLGFREDVPELLRVFDVFVLTSQWEGLGRSLTEAMYTGRPVVATEVEGVPELVRHERTGLLVPPRDVRSVAHGVIDLLSDPCKRQRLGEAARRQVRHAFGVERMVSDLEALYEEILRDRRGG